MIENRELTVDDYLAMLRRRLKVILLPTLLTPLLGFAVSYAFTPKYTSTTLVLVEEQKVPEAYVKQVVNQDLSERVTRLEQRALSAEELRPMIEKIKSIDPAAGNLNMEEVRTGVSIQAVQAAVIAAPGSGKGDVPGFNVNFTGRTPQQAREVCSELANIIIRENFADREQVARDTTDFLGRQVADSKRSLDELDTKLAEFKKKFIGQLPGDEEKNLEMLRSMNSQLDAATQTLNRAQQDKAYAESMLATQLAAWKSSENSSDPKTLQKQMADLQDQLLQLKARYTDEHPEVIKTKNDIKALQKKIDDVNAAAANPSSTSAESQGNLAEPPEIQQLRLQVHTQQQTIAQATRAQQQIQAQIKVLEGRVALSPAVEQQYKELTRDYDSAQKRYNDLLLKKAEAETQTDMEREQQGEQMHVLRPADLPDSPSFPNRILFAGGGLAGGLVLGFGLAMWLEFRDKSVRSEADVIAILDLPVLTQLPWVTTEAEKNGKAEKRKTEKETVEV